MTQPRKQVEDLMEGAGFYSWSLSTNTLTADAAFAAIYEISGIELARGVPVEFILERILEEDRPRLAARVHDVILGGRSFVSPYRIQCPGGRIKSLLSMGSCSKDQDGVPSIYSGIVLVEKEVQVKLTTTRLATHIGAAIDLARSDRLELTERYLSSALRSLHE